jgi:transposase-like protein
MKKRVKFSKDFKLKAVHLSGKSDSIQDVATSLGISGGLLYRWRKEYLDREGEKDFVIS